MNKASLVAATLLCLFATPSMAQTTVTGNSLLRDCEEIERMRTPEGSQVRATHCLGYVLGLSNGIMIGEVLSKATVCIPKDSTAEQLSRVVLKYLRENPAQLHEHAGFMGVLALVKAFPCSQEQSNKFGKE